MTTINVDFSDVEQQDRTPIKPGKYDVVIDEIRVRQAEGKPHPYLNIKMSIVDGEYEGRPLYTIASLSPKALWRLQEIFQSFGLDEDAYELEVDDEDDDEGALLLEPDLTGEAAVATVRNQLYDGKPQARVTALVGGAEEKPKRKAKPKPKNEDEDEDEEEEEPKPKRAAAKGRAKPKDEDEETEEEDEEDEEEEKPKARRAAATKAKAKPATKRRFR